MLMPCNILLSGATGTMGRAIQVAIDADPDYVLAGQAHRSQPLPDTALADVVIDFSRAEQTRQCLDWCREHGRALVIGTTGLDEADLARIRATAEFIPVCLEANFSMGVHMLYSLAARAASGLGEGFDVEVLESHHRRKADAPSGTALALGQVLASHGEFLSLPDSRPLSSVDRIGPRKPGVIGFQSLRGGDVAGEHTVYFLGDGERLELTHRATDRTIFARGALRAASRLQGRAPGLYRFSTLLFGAEGACSEEPAGRH